MQVLHGVAVGIRYPGGAAKVVGVVPIYLVSNAREIYAVDQIRKLCRGSHDVRVERPHEAVGTVQLVVCGDCVRYRYGQRRESAATDLRGDTLRLGIVVLGVALWGDYEIGRSIQRGIRRIIVNITLPVAVARRPAARQLVGALAGGVILVVGEPAVVGHRLQTVVLRPNVVHGVPVFGNGMGQQIARGLPGKSVYGM